MASRAVEELPVQPIDRLCCAPYMRANVKRVGHKQPTQIANPFEQVLPRSPLPLKSPSVASVSRCVNDSQIIDSSCVFVWPIIRHKHDEPSTQLLLNPRPCPCNCRSCHSPPAHAPAAILSSFGSDTALGFFSGPFFWLYTGGNGMSSC